MAKQTLDFKLRSWLIRRISGKHSFEKLVDQRNKHAINVAVEKMYENLQQYCDAAMSASIQNMPQNLLAGIIAANTILTDSQKSQIANILNSSGQNNTGYLG
ncbi:hypothetical protein [Nitrososphaera sp.]|uniref:hypothetical protein n=1 Tax=Nitrososphaera sp. TaxID=1971748 RepID=UPI00316DE190